MKGFMLDDNGDIAVKNNKIQMISNKALIIQRIKMIIGTNFGEWVLNRKEGINFKNLMGKNVSEDIVRNELLSGLRQISDDAVITKFNMNFDSSRKLCVRFTAKIDNIEYDIEHDY